MADIFTKKQRSKIMGCIRNKDSGIEIAIRKLLYEMGYRYRKNYKKLPGKPDMVITASKLAIFVDACFWHGCPKHGKLPTSNRKFWREKIGNNKKRDRAINILLKKMGYKVLRIWEHQIKSENTEKLGKKISKMANRKFKE